ncbi:MAG: hypothetical protein AAGU74_03915 [Bacillota bacterium]
MCEEKNVPLDSAEQEKKDIVHDVSVCSAEFTIGCTLTVEEQD